MDNLNIAKDQPLPYILKCHLPINYFLLVKLEQENNRIVQPVKSRFHNTAIYNIHRFYKIISNVL